MNVRSIDQPHRPAGYPVSLIHQFGRLLSELASLVFDLISLVGIGIVVGLIRRICSHGANTF
jgi:hypothetical protein